MTTGKQQHPEALQKTVINPWQWQDNLGFSQAIEVCNTHRTLYCAGQAAIDENGIPSSRDMKDQIQSCLDNLETVLTNAGYKLSDLVRLLYHFGGSLFCCICNNRRTSCRQQLQAFQYIIGSESIGFPAINYRNGSYCG